MKKLPLLILLSASTFVANALSVVVKDSDLVRGDGTYNSRVINLKILQVHKSGGGTVDFNCSGGSFPISEPIFILDGVNLEGHGITLSATSREFPLFQTGVLVNNLEKSNYVDPYEPGFDTFSTQVIETKINDFTVTDAGLGFFLFNFREGSSVTNIQFLNCSSAIDASFSFYSSYSNIIVRGDVENYALRFRNSANAILVKSVFVSGRGTSPGTAFSVFDAHAFSMINCSAENVASGVSLQCTSGAKEPVELPKPQVINHNDGSTALTISGCYFENISRAAIDAYTGDVIVGLTVQGSIFSGVDYAIRGRKITGIFWEGSNHIFAVGPRKGIMKFGVDDVLSQGVSNVAPSGTLFLDQQSTVNNMFELPLPEGSSVPSSMQIAGVSTILNTNARENNKGSDLALVKNRLNSGPIPFDYTGTGGHIDGDIPFAQVVRPAEESDVNHTTNSFSIRIRTKITYDPYNFLDFALDISDGAGTSKIIGRIVGDRVFYDFNPERKAVDVIADADGNILLKISGFSHPRHFFNVTGVIRHQ